MSRRVYVETFDDGPGGWIGWNVAQTGSHRLEMEPGIAISRSPWWVDYNHCRPGAGYLHLLYALHTLDDGYQDTGGANRFVRGKFPTNFVDAEVTVRLKGDVNLRGAALVFWVQGKVGDLVYNYALTGQPIPITRDWSEQTIALTTDLGQWTAAGSRLDRRNFYAWGDVADVLRDLNLDIIFTLFPLDVVPAAPVQGDPHRLRAGVDYPVDRTRLPEGHVMLDEVRIAFAPGE